jgi:very-short-patch-repair endonuclease
MVCSTLHTPRIVTRAQLLAMGRTRSAIGHALRDKRLFEVHRGVYAVGHPRLTNEERWLAAVLACGAGALLDHRSAAQHRQLLEPRGGPPHVLVPSTRRLERPGIVVHRTRRLLPEDSTHHRGIAITGLRRMFISLAATEDRRTLRRALRQAEYRHLIEVATLHRSLDDAVRSPGAARLRKLLDTYLGTNGITESDPEDDLLALCARYAILTPVVQYRLGPYRWDFAWPAKRVVLDVDEYEGHHKRIPFAEDRAKDRHARANGHVPLRVADLELAGTPREVAQSIRDALGVEG